MKMPMSDIVNKSLFNALTIDMQKNVVENMLKEGCHIRDVVATFNIKKSQLTEIGYHVDGSKIAKQ